jgi:predicted TIM-barrel fold metal-dependent hydrolase
MIARRTFIKGASLAAIAATTSGASIGESLAQQVPNSSGTDPAKVKAPPGACDCHHHIYDVARFPQPAGAGGAIPNARVEEFRLLQKRIGTTRSIIVQPGAYLTDNHVTLDAIAQLAGNSRGVDVVHPTVTEAELKVLNDGGIRGIRFSLGGPNVPATAFDMIEPLAKRVHAFGWHLQINMEAHQIVDNEALWDRVPTPLVFDHMGHIRQPAGIEDPAYKLIRRLIDKGRTWVKLSVTYDSSKDGPPGYADVNKVGQAYVKAAPERMLWGSNWPHPNETAKPNDAMLFDLIAQWAPDEATRNRILVDNPATLYGFPKAG